MLQIEISIKRGLSFARLSQVKLNSLDTDGLYQEYPSRVTRPRNFYITGVNSKIPGLSFVKLGIGGTTVEIRNLPVQW